MNQTIVFAGGCFWGTEHFFRQIRGVTQTQVGYANGKTQNPTYEKVKTGETGYAEAVKVTFDPEILSLEKLVSLYLETVDPTSINQQGEDIGSQYRTGIYTSSEKDRSVVEKALADLAGKYTKPIAIESLPLTAFCPAEEYHQRYLEKNPQGYCHLPPALFARARKAN